MWSPNGEVQPYQETTLGSRTEKYQLQLSFAVNQPSMATPIPLRIPWRSMTPIIRYSSARPAVRQVFRAQCVPGQRRNKSDDFDDFTRKYLESLQAGEEATEVGEASEAKTTDFAAVLTSESPATLDSSAKNSKSILSFLYDSPALSFPPNSFPVPEITALSYLYLSPTLSIPPQTVAEERGFEIIEEEPERLPSTRLPRAVQAVYLRALKRQATYGLPVCSIQFRSYNVRNLEFFCDFALRAAYYLKLPAHGPIPLPRKIKRWTVPRGHFIHKKKQENYERKTFRRLISIKDGSAESVELWLAFLRKHAYYGVGMKANVWEFAGLNVGKDMDAQMEAMRTDMESLLGQFAFKEGSSIADKIIDKVNEEYMRQSSGYGAPMVNTPNWQKPLNWGTREETLKQARGPNFKQAE